MFRIRDVAPRARIYAAAAAATALTVTLTGLNAAPASARPAYPSLCGTGGICLQVLSAAGDVATIRAYPSEFTFYGHFELQAPDGAVYNSITAVWHQNGSGNHFNNIVNKPNIQGEWVVTAWEPTNNTGGYEIAGRTVWLNCQPCQ